jgi:hypothetical protein
LAPLIGAWEAEAATGIGRVRVRRTLAPVLNGAWLQLTVEWQMPQGTYRELAVIGSEKGKVRFWSFTSDGKRSEGTLAKVTDLHPEAVGFEATMPAGLARMAYWPADDGGFHWVVEAKTKKGWRRFTDHHYRPARDS